MIAELQEPIPGRLMGWIHSRYESSNCDRRSSWEVPWNTYHIQQLNPLHWPVVSNIFYFTLSLWGLNVQGKIVFADKAQLYAWCCILILAKLLRDLEFLSVGFFLFVANRIRFHKWSPWSKWKLVGAHGTETWTPKTACKKVLLASMVLTATDALLLTL